MELIDHVQSMGPAVPERLKKHVSIISTIELTDHEAALLSLVLDAVDREAKARKAKFPTGTALNIMLLGDDDATMRMEPDVWGQMIHAAILPVGKWRRYQLTDVEMVAIMLEELCHFFFDLPDDSRMEKLVQSLINQRFEWDGDARYEYRQIIGSISMRKTIIDGRNSGSNLPVENQIPQ